MKRKECKELKQIFSELKKGNKEVIEELYNKYSKMIYGIAFSILKNKDDSEDIVQTVFSKLHTIDSNKLPTEKESTWLYTVTKNETLMFCRKNNKICDIEKIYDLEDENNEIDKIVDKESYNQLISKLNSKEKEIISLKLVSNLSFGQISELLGEPVSTVKWRYYKSIYVLKIMLSNLGMFILTFILGISTFTQTKKSSNTEIKQEIKDEITEDKENIYDNYRNEIANNKTESLDRDENIKENQTQENINIEQPITQHDVNYFGYGMLGISSIFLIITIVFAIILKKHQLKCKKKASK